MGHDRLGITGSFCAIAETGTLVFLSGADTPTATALLPDTHIAVVRADRIVSGMEEAFALIRARTRNDAARRQHDFRAFPDRRHRADDRARRARAVPRSPAAARLIALYRIGVAGFPRRSVARSAAAGCAGVMLTMPESLRVDSRTQRSLTVTSCRSSLAGCAAMAGVVIRTPYACRLEPATVATCRSASTPRWYGGQMHCRCRGWACGCATGISRSCCCTSMAVRHLRDRLSRRRRDRQESCISGRTRWLPGASEEYARKAAPDKRREEVLRLPEVLHDAAPRSSRRTAKSYSERLANRARKLRNWQLSELDQGFRWSRARSAGRLLGVRTLARNARPD